MGNDTARNVIIFGVNNSSSSHVDKKNFNHKNNFLILDLYQTFGINGSFDSPEKKFTEANTKFCFSLDSNAVNSYLFINGKEIIKFKADNKNVNFPTRFCLGSISDGVSATESREVSLNGNVYDFSVDYSSIVLQFYSFITHSQVFND